MLCVPFTHDGDGKRVKSIINSVTTYFVGNYYEVSGSTVKKSYYAGTQRVAMREDGTLHYILSDHLGSYSVIASDSGIWQGEQRYKAWGEIRYTSGTLPTRYQYTGQYSYTPEFGLYFYNARWYDPALGRFAQGDSIVPEGVQGWDRYAYVNNNPMRYVDPSGHDVGCAGYDAELCFGGNTTIAGDTRLIEGISRERMRFGYDPNPEITHRIIYQRLRLHHPQLNEIQNINITYISSWETPSWWDTDPQNPDYYSFGLYPAIVSIIVIIDRYGQVYFGVGVNIGKGLTFLSGSMTSGYIGSAVDNIRPDQANIPSFLSKWSINASAGVVGGIGVTWSPGAGRYVDETAWEYGTVLPGFVGVSLTYNWQVFDFGSLFRK